MKNKPRPYSDGKFTFDSNTIKFRTDILLLPERSILIHDVETGKAMQAIRQLHALGWSDIQSVRDLANKPLAWTIKFKEIVKQFSA